MNKIIVAALSLSFLASPALAQDAATAKPAVAIARGKMLMAADGARLGSIYRVGGTGPQIIMDGRMVTVPTDTVSLAGGKLTTSLTKGQVIALP